MKRSEILFERPAALNALAPAEAVQRQRDEGRLLVTRGDEHSHAAFRDLAAQLAPGDLIVVNDSATLPASLPALGEIGAFVVNLSTNYGGDLWLAEPRWSFDRPGPLPLAAGAQIEIAGIAATLVAPYPGLPRLWYIQFSKNPRAAMSQHGQPIRYGYVANPQPLAAYQTVFARVPGSAEMPSAAYPFTERVVNNLRRRGVGIAALTLHTGVSSQEVEVENVEDHPLYPEPFHVPAATAAAINKVRANGNRVIAIGTTVVRALETAWDGHAVQPMRGFTRVFVHPGRGVHAFDGLLTGMHDSATSHLALLYAVAGKATIQAAYEEAIRAGYLWHEFGDSHLILTGERAEMLANISRN